MGACTVLGMHDFHACNSHRRADVVQNLGKHQQHITIAHKQRPGLASISPLDQPYQPYIRCRQTSQLSSSATTHNGAGPLFLAQSSTPVPACCSGSGSPGSQVTEPTDPTEPVRKLDSLLHFDQDSFQRMVHDLQGKVNEVSAQLNQTSVAGVLGQLRSSEKTLKQTRGVVQNAQKKVKNGWLGKMLHGGTGGWLARRPVPWLWNVSPGASASVQVGAAGRLPVDSQEMLGLLRGRGEGPHRGAQPQNGSLWGAVFAPLTQRLCMQPLLRARLEGTIGKFRNIAGDHTSGVLELETCCRAAGAALAGPELLRSQQPPGLCHVLSMSVKQQVVGPVRACADVRWEVGSSACAQSAGDGADVVGGQWLGRVQRYCQGMSARRTGLNVGVDVSFGVARAAAWYSVHHRQGMIELRV